MPCSYGSEGPLAERLNGNVSYRAHRQEKLSKRKPAVPADHLVERIRGGDKK